MWGALISQQHTSPGWGERGAAGCGARDTWGRGRLRPPQGGGGKGRRRLSREAGRPRAPRPAGPGYRATAAREPRAHPSPALLHAALCARVPGELGCGEDRWPAGGGRSQARREAGGEEEAWRRGRREGGESKVAGRGRGAERGCQQRQRQGRRYAETHTERCEARTQRQRRAHIRLEAGREAETEIQTHTERHSGYKLGHPQQGPPGRRLGGQEERSRDRNTRY